MRKGEVRWLVVASMGLSFMLIALPSTARERRGAGKRAKKTQAESKQAESKQLESAVATVNGKVITRDSFNEEFTRIAGEIKPFGTLPPEHMRRASEMALEGLIGRELLYQESQKAEIKADIKLIKEELAAMKKSFPSQEEYDKALEAMNLTEDAIKSDIARGLATQEFVDRKFADKIHISDEEVKAYYTDNLAKFKIPEQVRARHILVRVAPGAGGKDKAEALAKIQEVQQKLNKGGDFAALAGKVSDCPSSSSGGDLGYFAREQMVKPFADTAFAMKASDVSDIVETRHGYHLIKVIDKKQAGRRTFEEVKQNLQQYLKLMQLGKDIEGFISKLKETANIVRMLPGEAK